MDRSSFPFSLVLSYQREPPKPRPGGLPRLVVKLSQKPLAVPAFTVQNGRAKSWVTLCSTTLDRAEISRINAHPVALNRKGQREASPTTRPSKIVFHYSIRLELIRFTRMQRNVHRVAAAGLLISMFFLAGGAALHESATVDEVAHVGAGLSYLQRLDLRLNPEHPPLGKALAAFPLAIRGAHADYSGASWKLAADFFPAYGAQWIFGDAVLGRWNNWKSTLMWARFPMLILTLLLGWFVYYVANRIGGSWGGLLCLSAYVTSPAFLVFGPLVITDLPVTLFSLIALWELGETWGVPSPRNALLFGVSLGAALLSKFTGLLIVPVIVVLFVQTRFWPTTCQPAEYGQRRAWRRARRSCVLRGLLWAALTVYIFYFVLSWTQPNDALNRIGNGPWASLIRRPLMPLWLYCRGLLLMLQNCPAQDEPERRV
jgi:4-amino-4-deoxy-L-arabinose transferase-like glycosyltransferase